jgi:hypothetical protein
VTRELFDAKIALVAACTRYDWTNPIQAAQREARTNVNFVNATQADAAPMTLLRFVGAHSAQSEPRPKRKRTSPENGMGGKLGSYRCMMNWSNSVNEHINTCLRAINEYVSRTYAALPAKSRRAALPSPTPTPSTPIPAVVSADAEIAALVSQLSRALIARRELTPEAFDTSQAAGLALFSVPITDGGSVRGMVANDNPGHFHKELTKLFGAANDINTWVDEEDRYMAYTYLDDDGPEI